MKEDTFYFTVGQLIEALQAIPQDFPILTSGYESGFDNVCHPAIRILKQEPDNWYTDGEFQTAEAGDLEVFEAVVLGRVMRDD